MPDERREFHKIRPASHTLLSVHCLYQMNAGKRKWVFTKLRPMTRSLLRQNNIERRGFAGESPATTQILLWCRQAPYRCDQQRYRDSERHLNEAVRGDDPRGTRVRDQQDDGEGDRSKTIGASQAQ